MKVVLNIGDQQFTLTKLSPRNYKKFRDMLNDVADMDLFRDNNYTDQALEQVETVIAGIFEKEGLTADLIDEEGDIQELVTFVREVQINIEKGAAERISQVYDDFFQKSAASLAQKISSNS
jgi:hypothetical protein